MEPSVNEPAPVIPPEPNSAPAVESRASQLRRQRRQRRVERYNEVMRLYKEGHSQKAISRMLGIERKTVQRFLRYGQFPERGNRSASQAKSNSFANTSSSAGNRAVTMPLSSGAKFAIGAIAAAAAWLR